MSQDAKLFSKGKVQELRAELHSDKKDKGFARKKVVLKKIVANMTMGNDMSPLFTDIVQCMNIQILEIKKMVYLYLINYSRVKPDLVAYALDGFLSDSSDRNPLIRALAIRTMSYIPVPAVHHALVDPLRHSLKDTDPYVRKTAAICVAKLFAQDRMLVEKEGFVGNLRDLLADANSTVIANAVAALMEMCERSDNISLRLNMTIANRLMTALVECSEWGQTYIIEALMYLVPEDPKDAEILAERLAVRLQHANSAVVLTTIKVILYLMNYMADAEVIETISRRLSAPLITLLSSGPEVQYVALRNILLIIQRRPTVLKNEVKVFFCKYNDPIYVKLAKLEIMCRLATAKNAPQVLAELAEYATEVDVDFVRKSVRSIGRLAIKISSAADRCITTLLSLVETKISYVVQEAVVVIKDIFRRYPNQYEGIIGKLCDNLDALDTPDAKAAMIWIIGQYADRIENSEELLEDFLYTFMDEAVEVQLALLTATVKLFIKRPTTGAELVPKVLKWATEDVDNPDLRDRGYIYWRLLSTDPAAAKDIVMAEKPAISTEAEGIDRALLDRLLLQTGTLSSVYHRNPEAFIRGVKPKNLHDSPALNQAAKESYRESMRMAARRPPPVLRTSTVPKPPPKASTSAGGGGAADSMSPILPKKPANGLNGTSTSLGPITDVADYVGEPEALLDESSRGGRESADLETDDGDTTVGTTAAVAEAGGAGAAYDPYAGLGALEGDGGYLGLNGGYATDAPTPLRGMTGF